MKQPTQIKLLATIIVFIILFQGFAFYQVINKTQQTIQAINSTEQKINEKINILDKETQAKISSLIDTVDSLATSQLDIQNQLAKVKASASADFSGIIEEAVKGVVSIKTNIAQGTGFIITKDGFIVTNAHVLSSARYANIYTYDNEKYPASLIGYDVDLDLALLKVSGNFDSIQLGNSDNVKVGEKVIAIGNPLGLSFSISEGIISATGRSGISNTLPYYFQTDTALNPGNSGGPLINTNGEVIGINNFKISEGENIGFALMINPAKDKLNSITLKELNQTLL